MLMNIKHFELAFTFALMSVAAVAQVKVETGVTFYTPDIVRIHKTWNDAPRQDYSVIMEPQQVKVSQSRDGDTKVYKSSELTVRVSSDNVVTFLDSKGKLNAVCKEYTSVGTGEFSVVLSL